MNSERMSIDAILSAGPDASTATSSGVAPHEPDAFFNGLVKRLVGAVRQSASLPSTEDFAYFSSFPEFRSRTEKCQVRPAPIAEMVGSLTAASNRSRRNVFSWFLLRVAVWVFVLFCLSDSSCSAACQSYGIHRVFRHR